MGVAAGDIDNDGWIDLYLTGFGRNQMFHNNGDGTFTDVSKIERHRRSGVVGRVRRRSSISIATAGSTCSSATI